MIFLKLISSLILVLAMVMPLEAVDWDKQAAEDAKQDRIVLAYDGVKPDRWMVCDTVPRVLPDGRIALYFLAGGTTEPSAENFIGVIYSGDNGDTWSELQPVNINIPRQGNTKGQGPTEVLVTGERMTMFFATHGKTWDWSWRSWTATSTDNGNTWSQPQPLPGRLEAANFMRPYIITRDKRIMIPFQHYLGKLDDQNHPKVSRNRNNPELYNTPVTNSRNGVLISQDGGLTWSEHGNIRCPLPDNTHLWAEPAIVEPTKGRIVMLIRPRWGGGTTLYKAESLDGGLTWSEVAEATDIPNPSSKVALFLLGEDCVALVHNPNPNQRKPLALWISFDGMKTWAYKRVLVEESLDGKKGNLNYPEGYVTPDRKWLHIAFDSNRHQAVFVRAKLPPLDHILPVKYDDSKPMPLIPPQDKLPPKADKKILDMSLETPKLLTNPGTEYDDDHRDYNMTIGIERTPKGRLWAAWVSGGDSDKGFFVLATSDDEGKTWSKPRLVIDPTNAPNGLRRRILVGNLWTDPLGRLWLFFDQSMGYYDGRAGDWATVCENPDADNPIWSTPVRIWHGATLCKPTVISSGEWLLPISFWERSMINPKNILAEANNDLDNNQRGANVFTSSDQGKTWNRLGHCRFPVEQFSFDEHSIVERKDGSLWMLARTARKGIMQSFSTDQGKTWSKPTEAFPHIAARFFIRKLDSGNILFVRHGKMDEVTKGRVMLTAFLSEDDGKTWKGGLVLDERGQVSYPDGFQFPDGRICISYDRNRGTDAEVLMSIFTEEDILAGKPVSGKTVFKQIISKAKGKKK
ncbi:MAG: glycoside hydrolase [Planctomycetaceae bacterium]|jgi:predicted neuraminidase|nr:glycoside hydrolase [Planctomycetaceae bacterium]